MWKPSASRVVVAGVMATLLGLVVGPSAALARRAVPRAAPTVAIVSPSRCACGVVTPQSSTVVIVVEVTNFKLSAAHFGKAPVKGEGHLLFSLDHGKFDHPKYAGANGRLAASIGLEAKYSPSVTSKITYTNLPAGWHTVVVYLVGNDQKKVGPNASLKFKVQ